MLGRCLYSGLVGGLPFVGRVALLACIGGLAFVVCAFGGFLLCLLHAYVYLTIVSLFSPHQQGPKQRVTTRNTNRAREQRKQTKQHTRHQTAPSATK